MSAVPDYKTEGPFRVDVLVINEKRWASNALRFDTEKEALAYAHDLYSRWMGADKMRIVSSDTPDRQDYINGAEHSDWSNQ